MARFSQYRWLLALALLIIGLATVISGAWLETRHPRSNVEDDIAWGILAAGMFLIGVAVSLPFVRPLLTLAIGIIFPVVGWWFLVAAFWVMLLSSGWPSQQQMVLSGYRMIPEAKQIDELLGPAWHQVANYREPDIAEWQTEELFAGRYELHMSVSIRIDRHSGRVMEVIGDPQFRLLEIQEIKNSSRDVSYNGNHQREFGIDQWRQVVKAQGDFSVIGIQLDRNHTVSGFDRYQAAYRSGIQMRPKDDAALAPNAASE